MTWKARYDRMKAHYNWTDADVARITGNSAASVRTVVTTKKDFPRWPRLAIHIFEAENKLNDGFTVNL